MSKLIRCYTYIILVSFIVNVITLGNVLAQVTQDDLNAWENTLMSDEVIQGVFGGVIGDQSQPGDMDQAVAPAPRVIESANGDISIRFSDSAQANIATTAEGLTEVTYSLSGTRVIVEVGGETLEYFYELDGANVKLINQNGAVVREESYDDMGNLIKTSQQGTTDYVYSTDGENKLLQSIDQWGNVTEYDDEQRPKRSYYIDENGQEVDFRTYSFDIDGVLETIVDEKNNLITFKDGIRVEKIEMQNDDGSKTLTTQYHYDPVTDELTAVEDVVNGSITYVENGDYVATYDIVTVFDPEGNAVLDGDGNVVTQEVLTGVFNYDDAGNIASVTAIGDEGTITGWTDYDEFGRIEGTYNHTGTLVQDYLYNDRGFLQQTLSLGAFDPLSGDQTVISITNFDKRGRPDEVWQVGDGDNKIKIQEYVYKDNGLLDYTNSLGILRGTDENNLETYNKPVDENGALIQDNSYVYFVSSKTEYDKKGRPEAVYSLVRNDAGEYVSGYDDDGNTLTTSDPTEAILEKSQSYKYGRTGFLEETISYGFGKKITGKTQFDRYGRPAESTNGQGAKTQEYSYDEDTGFLNQTINFGTDGAMTGHTNYDSKGKPSEVYNHEGTLTQKYIYDENGSMIMSINLNGEDGINTDLIATADDMQMILDMFTSEMQVEAALATGGNYSDSAFLKQMWDAWDEDVGGGRDLDLTKAIALTIIILFDQEVQAGNEDLVNAVGTAYHMLGQVLEEEGNNEGAIAAYKVQVSEFGGAMAFDPEANGGAGDWVPVTSWSLAELGTITNAEGDPVEVNTSVVTGYTLFGGDSKPIASYSCYDDGSGLEVTKVQEYDYSYEDTDSVIVGYDENNRPIYQQVTSTKYSNFVRKTINFGDYLTDENGDFILDNNDNRIQAQTGYTVFDDYGRQEESYNDEGNIVQKYSYSSEGFLEATYSYGKDKALTGVTIFDKYSRPVASFNNTAKISQLPDELLTALEDGLSEADLNNSDWQPYLKGITQTFEYGTDGLLETSKSWGEAVAISVSNLSKFADSLGSAKGDDNYKIDYDFNEDGEVNDADMAILESKFAGATNMVNSYLDGSADTRALNDFARTFDNRDYYLPTQTGSTKYDKYGKASEVISAEPIYDDGGNLVADGIVTQRYVYNERGFLERSDSIGIQMDEYGNVTMNGDVPAEIRTGYTVFNAYSRPTETYSVYHKMDIDDDGNVLADYGVQEAKVQDYVYEGGFLVQTNNYGRNGTFAGHTEFDKYGRQTESFNEEGQRTTKFVYSSQGFMKETYNYGASNSYLGKTVFDKKGKPIESYNNTNNGKNLSGITQTFNYNEYGVLASSTSYGENQTKTGQTFYNGYGKAMYSTNDMGIANSVYEYDEFGFLDHTLSLAFREGAGPDTATHNNLNNADDTLNGVERSGQYVITGYTEFSDTSRPVASYQCYVEYTEDGVEILPSYGDGALVQQYNYEEGFLVSTSNYAKDGTFTGTTVFDRYGRQQASYNDVDTDGDGLGELTTKFYYSRQGFMNKTINYGLNRSTIGTTTFNELGRPVESTNQRGSVTQEFTYDSFTGAMIESTSYGEDSTITGTTEYDAWGKAITQYNAEGNIVAKYEYDNHGFMTRAFSFSGGTATDVGVCTGFTTYNAAGRPEAGYSVFNPTTESGDLMGSWADEYFYYGIDENTTGVTKVQDFIYNSDVEYDSDMPSFIGNNNTGFLTATISYGDEEEFMGYTLFNRYGQQTYSYNEFGEKTTKFQYSRQGFLEATYNYGINNTFTGKTLFNALGRPDAAYNERGKKVQGFIYEGGFLVRSQTYGDPGDGEEGKVTGITTYDAYGKQLASYNNEGVDVDAGRPYGAKVGDFEYSENGFMTRANSYGTEVNEDGSWSDPVLTGYTVYNNKVRPESSFTVFNDGTGDHAALSQTFSYDNGSGPNTTGFVTGATNYVVNIDHSFEDNIADEIGVEVLESGTVEYSRYGRPESTYNKEGSLISKNIYNRNGFIEKTDNYGADNKRVGSLYYNDSGRPEYATNHQGGVTTEYIYNDAGFLSQTVGYTGGSINETTGEIEGVRTSFTTFDVYSKSINSYQLWTHGGQTEHGYQYAEGGIQNYGVNGDGSIYLIDANGDGQLTDGLTSTNANANCYNEFGSLLRTDNIGREGSVVSSTYFDSFSKPTSIWNDAGALVQVYHYSDQGFLDYSISYAEMESFDDDGDPVADGSWDSEETTITFFNGYGQQTESYLLSSDGTDATGWALVSAIQNINGQDGLELGAKQSQYQYDRNGFLEKTMNYQDGQYVGYIEFDASGRQLKSYNADNTHNSTYYYDINGFLTRSVQVQS